MMNANVSMLFRLIHEAEEEHYWLQYYYNSH